MSASTELKEDLAHYNRRPVGDPDRSYLYLPQSMERNMDLAQQKRNRASDSAAILKGKGAAKGVNPAFSAPDA
eukprot:6792031-Heterocapsa_arctica.AAC.1